MPKIILDGQEIITAEGATLLEAARGAGVEIPTICWHPATTSNGLCRLCVVEVEGMRLLQPGCIVRAAEGMKVQTRSERVMRARRTILEMPGRKRGFVRCARNPGADAGVRRFGGALSGRAAAGNPAQG